jgi:hypothetical protein
MDTLPNVPAEAPETQQQSLYYPLELVRLSPVEAHRHVHRQRRNNTAVRRVRGQSPHCLRRIFNSVGW